MSVTSARVANSSEQLRAGATHPYHTLKCIHSKIMYWQSRHIQLGICAEDMTYELCGLCGNFPKVLADNAGEGLECVLHLNCFIHISGMNLIAEI